MTKYIPLVGGCIVDFPTELEGITYPAVRKWVEDNLPADVGGLSVVPAFPDGVRNYFEGSASGMITGGGPGNTGRRLAGLDVPARIHGYVGDDRWGNFYRSSMQEAGVDVTRIKVDPNRSTSATVVVRFVHDGIPERSFIHVLGANLNDPAGMYEPSDSDAELGYFGYLYITGKWPESAEGIGAVLERMRNSGKVAVLATTADPRRTWTGAEPALREADIFLANRYEAGGISGMSGVRAMTNYFHELEIPIVSITRGAEGCAISHKDGRYYQKDSHRAPAEEALAVGDSYAAGIIYALQTELERTGFDGVDIDLMLDCGNAMGALAAAGYRVINTGMLETVFTTDRKFWPNLSGLV